MRPILNFAAAGLRALTPLNALVALVCLLGLTACFPAVHGADEEWVLWPRGAPGALGDREPDRPRLFLFQPLPERANGVGVLIASGGSYGHHGGLIDEGVATARWLAAHGFTAALVRYRVGEVGGYGHRAMLGDAERAVRFLRHRAGALGIQRLGVIGYSAGGHIAGWLATRCAGEGKRNPAAADPVGRESCQVDFSVMVYPVVTMFPPDVHERSRDNLLRDVTGNPDSTLHELSLEEHVHRAMAPTLLVHSELDGKVPVGNSVRFASAAKAAGADATLLRYPDGGHGVGLANFDSMPCMRAWPAELLSWLHRRGLDRAAP